MMSNYNELEKVIIKKGSVVKGKTYELWEPHLGIINIYEESVF